MSYYTYKVNYRLNRHPLAPYGFYSYEIEVQADTTAQARSKAISQVRQNVTDALQEKHRIGLIPSVPNISHMTAQKVR